MRLYEPVKLSDYCEITSSKRIYAKEYVDSGVPFYRGKEVVASFSGGNVSDPLFISENRFEEIKHRFGAPEKGDLLLTSVGTIGVPYRVSGEFDFYFKDGNLTWFRKLNGVDQNFLYYWLQSPQGKAELSKCTIGAAQPAYTIERLKEISIELPPENIQRDIASVIADYDLALKNNRRRIQLLEESARLLYQEWFVHLRFPGHEQVRITDGVPEGWEKKPLTAIAAVNQTSLKKGFDERIEYIDISCVSTHSISDTTWYEFAEAPGRARRIVKHCDILWSCVRPNRRSHVLVWEPHDRLIASTGFAVISATQVSPFFLYQSLITNDYVGYLTNRAGGAAYPAVTAKVFEESLVLVPNRKLIEQYDDQVKDTYAQINMLRSQNAKLAQARDLLLPKLMSGELTV